MTRGCGSRVVGGIYAEVRLGAVGKPVEAFLLDPPQPIDTVALGLRPIGVSVLPMRGSNHVFDWVGMEGYPNVADFIEEMKVMGLSRRISKAINFGQLTEGSRIVLLHHRALIENHRDYYEKLTAADKCKCPHAIPSHDASTLPAQMCAGLWWQDVTGGKVPITAGQAPQWRQVERVLPSVTYHAQGRPDGVSPRYKVAAFASFPITNLAVIRDPHGDAHKAPLAAATAAGLPVTLEDV